MSILYPRATSSLESSSEWGVTLTADTTAHVKGTWVELEAATAFEGFLLKVGWRNSSISATDTSTLCDIGIDPAGGTSYSVLIPNIPVGFAKAVDRLWSSIAIPIYIPTGSTIAGRIQSLVTGGHTAVVAVVVSGGVPAADPFPSGGLVVTYGANTSDSGGVAQLNATADVKSAWIEITGATTHPHAGLTGVLTGEGTAFAAIEMFLDVGIGAATSEVVVVPDIGHRSTNAEDMGAVWPPGLLVAPGIPEGTRIATRLQTSSSNQGTDYAAIVIGWG